MKIVVEFTNGSEKELDMQGARFLEYQFSDLTVWGPDDDGDEMPVEWYMIDCGRPLEPGNRIRVWDLRRGRCVNDDGVTDENADIIALDARVTIFP